MKTKEKRKKEKGFIQLEKRKKKGEEFDGEMNI